MLKTTIVMGQFDVGIGMYKQLRIFASHRFPVRASASSCFLYH